MAPEIPAVRILIVDDDKAICEYMQTLLERDGFKYHDEGRIAIPAALALDGIPQVGLDTAHLDVYLTRINNSVENDPELAIGSGTRGKSYVSIGRLNTN